ncbi:aldo/keto reductase [Oceanirhabdus seepicola]|uniref:Aldo/keto reductase n=1 Tax=Oceanirhabdus seepicola TaxID=2828781 RepID=A0A9J6P5X8_9CLOT|nr:aldo/keto reductase [Oceanirhabdus seepicola]
MESFDKGLKLGYGCYGLSGAYGKELIKKEKINLLNNAYDMGIRYFDTASTYGDSEEILGGALRRLNTDYIDIFHIHYGSKESNIEETIE